LYITSHVLSEQILVNYDETVFIVGGKNITILYELTEPCARAQNISIKTEAKVLKLAHFYNNNMITTFSISPGVKRQEREFDHSPSSSAEFNNAGATPLISDTSWRDV
jgi:hypothetical protein